MKRHTKLKISERIILLRVVDLGVIYIALFLMNKFLKVPYLQNFNSFINYNTLFLLGLFLFIGQIFELYNLRATASRYLTIKNLFLTTGTTVFIFLLIPYITPMLPENRIEILLLFIVVFIPVLLWRIIYIDSLANNYFYKRIIVIGGDLQILKELINYVQLYAKDHLIVGYVAHEPIENLDNFYAMNDVHLQELIEDNDVKEVLVSLRGYNNEELEVVNKNLIHFFEKGVNIVGFQDFIEKTTYCVPKQNLNKHFYKYFNFSEHHENRLYLLFHRILDVFIGILGLFFLGMILPFIWVVNLFANRGPMFYKQERVGLNGETFNIVKLRSMIVNAEKNGIQWAQKNDQRITTFGKVLRKSRLDEIPQFWNVLVGDMSLIGPRPERPEFVQELTEQFPFYTIRNVIKPGLTGWAQVMQPYASTVMEQEKKLRYDLYYIKKRSLFLDFKIIVKTINTVVYFRGN